MLFPSKFKERYEIKEELGAGGMGAVYRAYDKIIKSEVALKTLLDTSDAESLRMFREECDKLARLVHPNIVEIRDIGEFDNGRGKQPYLVMPLLRGKTLDALIKVPDERLSVARAVDILCQSCRGLQAAHDARLVHRDLKPSNIFVLEDDSVKLIDFGVAHWSDTTHTVGRKGTLLFMSPEQIMMKGVSPLSDIFSLGVVAYQTLTGRSPFERRTEEEVAQAIMHFTPPPASEYNSEVSLSLSQAVHKAIAKQPSNRYRSAREFGETLQKALHQQPIELFNPERIQPRIDRANQALDKGDLELASEIAGELDAEGHLDVQVAALQRKIEQLSRRKRVANLLDGARTRLREREYPLALQKIQEALELDRDNSDALALKDSIESRRAEQSVNDWLQLARQHIDNFAYDRAREALNNVVQLKPNDSRAVSMLSEVEKNKAEYDRIIGEKQRLHAAAESAFERGEMTSALSRMDRVLQLDKLAPDRSNSDGSTAYQSFYQQIRSDHDSMQAAYAEARTLQASGNYAAALEFCNENVAKYPNYTLLQALKLDLELSQRQQISGFIADVDRRVDSEPDLDKRLSILKEALDKFPEVAHFQTNYRLARDKRDLIESIVSKANLFEEQGQINEAVAQWEILRSIYDRYPGLDFEFQRIRKRQVHQLKAEARARTLEQIERALESNNHPRALELIEAAKQEFPNDAELAEMDGKTRQSAARVAEANNLLHVAEQMRTDGRLQEAVDTLRKAHNLDALNAGVNDALQAALIEEARVVLDADWRAAESLLQQAQDLGSGHYAVKGLLRAVADRRREEEVHQILEKARALQSAGDIKGAFALTSEKLKLYPLDLDIQQTHNWLKKQFDALPKDPSQDVASQRSSRISESDPSTAMAPVVIPVEQRPSRVVERLMTVTPNESASALTVLDTPRKDAGQNGAPDPKPNDNKEDGRTGLKTPTPFDPAKYKVQIGIGATVAVLLLGAALYPRSTKTEPVPPTPAVVKPLPTTISIRTTPPGASLVINKSVSGIGDGSPITVPAGDLTIEASLPGYQPITKKVFVNSGDKSSTELALRLLPPSIRVETSLSAGQVLVDDKPSGELQGGQFSLDSLPEGSHKFQVKSDHTFGFTFDSAKDGIVPSSISAGLGGTLVLVSNSGGKMQILCNRSGLTLKLDETNTVPCSTKPADMGPMTQGRHTLEVLEGQQSLGSKMVELGPATNLGAYLLGDSNQGILSVSGNVEDFTVSFNKHESGVPAKRGKWRRSLPPGDYVVTAQKEGYLVEPALASVKVEKGKDVNQAFTFTAIPTTSSIIIKSEPGADVSSNGKLLGLVRLDGTIELTGLPLGPLPIVLKKKGFADYRGTVQVTASQTVKPLSMQKEKVHVTLTSDPAGAQIVITRDGGSPGQTYPAPVNIELADGNYTIEVLANGYSQQVERVRLSAGEPYSHEFRLQPQKATVRPIPKQGVTPGWPGWELVDGYQTRSTPGLSTVVSGIPSQVSFIASQERKKTIFTRGGAIHWSFQAADGLGTLNFHLNDKTLNWDGLGKAKEAKGKGAITAGKKEHTIRMSVSGSAVSVTVDGGAPISVPVDLPAFGPSKFGFKVDGGETLSVKNFAFTPAP